MLVWAKRHWVETPIDLHGLSVHLAIAEVYRLELIAIPAAGAGPDLDALELRRARAVARISAPEHHTPRRTAPQPNGGTLYRGPIRGNIRGRANVPDTATGKPEVGVRITLLPGGEVLDIKLVKSSGNRIYDEAILRAIRSASPLPVPPANSELFPQFRDLILKIEHER